MLMTNHTTKHNYIHIHLSTKIYCTHSKDFYTIRFQASIVTKSDKILTEQPNQFKGEVQHSGPTSTGKLLQ
jgi:hypothetical protein